MRMRAVVASSALGLVLLIGPAMGQEQAEELTQHQSGPDLRELLEEARLNVEILNIEYQALKSQLTQRVQMAPQFEFSFSGMGGGFGGPATREEAKKLQEERSGAIRAEIERHKATVIEKGKELRREERRIAELENRLGEASMKASPADVERRLASVERKLDRVLKALADLKD